MLTEQEAGDLIGYAVRTMRRLRHDQRGPSFITYASGAIRYREDDVQSWIEAQDRTVTG